MKNNISTSIVITSICILSTVNLYAQENKGKINDEKRIDNYIVSCYLDNEVFQKDSAFSIYKYFLCIYNKEEISPVEYALIAVTEKILNNLDKDFNIKLDAGEFKKLIMDYYILKNSKEYTFIAI